MSTKLQKQHSALISTQSEEILRNYMCIYIVVSNITVVLERSGFGPRACSPWGVRHLVTVPPVWWGDRRAFSGEPPQGRGGSHLPTLETPDTAGVM